MSSFHPHRRYNPLKNEWILVSPQRTQRPWQGGKENLQKEQLQHDPNCYLCPENLRANGKKNPNYKNTFVFQNDFPALMNINEKANIKSGNLLKTENVDGECRVVCFSPKHNLTLAEMSLPEIKLVIETWIKQINELKQKYSWVQIFENKGEIMGCSNPHPHGQIWASNFIPTEIQKEDTRQKKYFQKNKSVFLVDYLKEEQEKNERVVLENESWVVVTPFWAIWPYETLLLPKTLKTNLTSLSKEEISDLTIITKNLLQAYDKLFGASMPYSMGWHFAPFNIGKITHWQLHAHYYPPLLRSATVKKFMVGYEMLAEAQRDITPEEAAQTLNKLL